MRIIHISDTHNMHRRLTNLPEGDVIVHSGDFTMMGTEGEALDFMEWFCDLPTGTRSSSPAITTFAFGERVWRGLTRTATISAIPEFRLME